LVASVDIYDFQLFAAAIDIYDFQLLAAAIDIYDFQAFPMSTSTSSAINKAG
jgi:hypothetical protein